MNLWDTSWTTSWVFDVGSISSLVLYAFSFPFSTDLSIFYLFSSRYKVPEIKTSLYSLGHLQTPLFSNVTFSPLTKLFLPSLEPSEVARRIVSGIEKRRSEEVGMPFAVNFAWIGRGLPSWARDFVQWVRIQRKFSSLLTNWSSVWRSFSPFLWRFVGLWGWSFDVTSARDNNSVLIEE